MLAVVVVVVTGALAAQPGDPLPEEQPLSPAQQQVARIAIGSALMTEYQCGRCHESGPMHVDRRDKHCVTCHRSILDGTASQFLGGRGAERARQQRQLDEWRTRIVHLRELPSLQLEGRVKASWLASFLMQPHDLRRGLGESMPRFPELTREKAEAMALAMTDGKEPVDAKVAPGDVQRGLALLEAKGCGMCHAFTGTPRPLVARALPPGTLFDGELMVRGMALAPDLRFTRERTTRARIEAMLANGESGFAAPATLPTTPPPRESLPGLYTPFDDVSWTPFQRIMPNIPLSTQERLDIVSALFDVKLAPLAKREPPPRLPLPERKVRFSEVRDAVLAKTCIHCHADDSSDLGVGGPGNNGGFGWSGTGLVLTSYARVAAGSARNGKQHVSVFRPVLDAGPLQGMPLLVAQLRARQIEEAGGAVAGVVGMPLALPAVTPEELQLVESWVAQGRPQ